MWPEGILLVADTASRLERLEGGEGAGSIRRRADGREHLLDVHHLHPGECVVFALANLDRPCEDIDVIWQKPDLIEDRLPPGAEASPACNLVSLRGQPNERAVRVDATKQSEVEMTPLGIADGGDCRSGTGPALLRRPVPRGRRARSAEPRAGLLNRQRHRARAGRVVSRLEALERSVG